VFVRAVAVGAVASALTVGLARSPSAAATSPVDVGNRELSVTCVGKASPTVLLEAPLATDSSIWDPIVKRLTKILPGQRVCTYDRANLGRSQPRGRHTIEDSVDDLHAVISESRALAPPVVLVGYSYGGLITRLLAARHPQDVAAMVLVEATPVGFHDEGRALIRRGRWSDFVGKGAAAFEGVGTLDQAAAIVASESTPGSLAVPLVVIVGTGGLEVPFATSGPAARALDALAARLQRETVALSAEGQLRTSGSTHAEILQDDAQLVSDAIAAATMSALGRVSVSP